jgi:predicted dienelactone hydrolase
VGYTELEFFDTQRSRTLETTLWYPTPDTENFSEQTYASGFLGYAKQGAERHPETRQRPLILLSHGDRGTSTNLAWLAERLVEQGYLVAGVDHWLNTSLHNEPEETLRLWNRPLDISFVLNQLLEDSSWGPRIDPSRIGVAGHSSGGYTAFALAGAIYEPELMSAYCQSEIRGPDCELTKDADLAKVDFSEASKAYRDPRIRAFFAMAPAVGSGIRASSLAEISDPVLVVATRDDELLDLNRNAIRYTRHTPGATLAVEEAGGHFVFMSRCSLLTQIFTYVLEFDICGIRSPVDRNTVQEKFSERAIAFFNVELVGDRERIGAVGGEAGDSCC